MVALFMQPVASRDRASDGEAVACFRRRAGQATSGDPCLALSRRRHFSGFPLPVRYP
jgi:hypothetical protein